MGQSLTSIYIHAIFATKHRTPFIDQKIEKELHAYMSGILKNKDSHALRINSMPDHVHILFRMSKNHTIAQLMQYVKMYSSRWMKTRGYSTFRWRNGYAAFSVSQSKVQNVTVYIANQKLYHHRQSLVQEVDTLMDKYGVDQYSKQFFWEQE